MSILNDLLKSGANSVAGAVSEKLGVDPAQAQSLVDQLVPGDDAQPAVEAQSATEAGQQEAPAAEDQGGLLGKVSSMLDQDGDGSPLNDIAGMASKFLSKN